jgi:hypothetical protein
MQPQEPPVVVGCGWRAGATAQGDPEWSSEYPWGALGVREHGRT